MLQRVLAILLLIILFPFPAEATRTVRVGVYENPPLVGAGKDGAYEGLAVEVLEHVARGEGWRLEFVPCRWSDCLAKLDRAEVDIQTAIAWSAERAKRYDFSRQPLLDNWGRIYVPPGSKMENVLDLAGRKIAVLKDDIHTRELKKTLDAFHIEPRLVYYSAYPAIFAAVEAREVDAGLVNRLFAIKNAARFKIHQTPIIFNPIAVHYAGPKDTYPVFLAAIDRQLAAARKRDGSWYYAAIERWLPEGPSHTPAWLWWLVGGLGFAVACGLAFIVALRRMVRVRTRELESERKKLAAEKSRSEAIIAGIGQGISIQDRDFRVLYQNENHTQIIGSHEGELCFMAYEGEEAVCEGCPVARSFADGKIHRTERHVVHPDHDLWVEITSSPLFGTDGEIIAGIELVQDIRERKEAEEKERALAEQLRQSQKMEAVGRLAGGVAHDFNNLLTSILGYCELALMETGPGHPLRENLEVIKSAGNKAATLTRQLLAYSRKQVMAFAPHDINRVVRSMLDILVRTLGEDIVITTRFAEALPLAEGDQGQVEQVIMNLAINARDAMPAGGTLTIETGECSFDAAYCEKHPAARPGPYVMIAISDDGEGMSAEVQERIFEPFFTTKEQGRGTGLGLATVYGIVKQHRGYIWVYSEKGRGTTFKVYLPVAATTEDDVTVAEDAQGFAEVPGGAETVMVVDDQEEVRNLVADVLNSKGYRVISCGGAEEAIRRATVEKVDLLISDVVMPGMNGRMLAERLQGISPETRVVFMSGYTDNHIVLKELRAEKIPFVQKPVSPRMIAAVVRNTLDSR